MLDSLDISGTRVVEDTAWFVVKVSGNAIRHRVVAGDMDQYRDIGGGAPQARPRTFEPRWENALWGGRRM